jgi:hypothetical protein
MLFNQREQRAKLTSFHQPAKLFVVWTHVLLRKREALSPVLVSVLLTAYSV